MFARQTMASSDSLTSTMALVACMHDGRPGANIVVSSPLDQVKTCILNCFFSHYRLLHNNYFLLHDDPDACSFQSVNSLIPLHPLILVTDLGPSFAPFGWSHFGLNALVALIWIP
jgi:hypothetical protein